MPLTAEVRHKGSDSAYHLVDITHYDSPRLELGEYELRCPECKQPMHVYQSLIRMTHFKHNPGSDSRDCALAAGEGNEHMYAKKAVADKLGALRGYEGARVLKEHWLANVERRADIFVCHSDGDTEVHEIQLARTTIDSLEERTNDYLRAGVTEVVWWFGGQADNDNNRSWAREKLGGYGELTITEGRAVVF